MSASPLSIVLPLHNEGGSLSELLGRLGDVLRRLGRPWDVVVVDDGSTDGTARLLRAAAGSRPWLKVVTLRPRRGQHAAVLAGMSVARGQLIVTMDADLEDLPEGIPTLLAGLKPEWEMVVARRAGRTRTRARTLISRFLNRLLRVRFRTCLRDNGSMMRVYRRRLVEAMVSWGTRRPFIPVLSLLLARSHGEVPVKAGAGRGSSRYSILTLLHVGGQVLRSLAPTLDSASAHLTPTRAIRRGRRVALPTPASGPEAETGSRRFAPLLPRSSVCRGVSSGRRRNRAPPPAGRGPVDGFFDLYWSERYSGQRRSHEYRHLLSESNEVARGSVAPLDGALLLEIGAGRGEDAGTLARQGARVVALDACTSVFDQWTASGCERVVGRAEELPFRGAIFDRVWGRAVLMHVRLRTAAQECHRVLSPGGTAVFIEPLRFHPLVVLYRCLCSVGRHSRPRPMSIREMDRVGSLFRRHTHHEFYLLGALPAGLRALGLDAGKRVRRRLAVADHCLLSRFPSLRRLAWITVTAFHK